MRTSDTRSIPARLLVSACFSVAVLTGCADEESGGGSGPTLSFGSGAISFSAPLQREDSTPLSSGDIAAYRVLYGAEPGDYSDEFVVDSSSTSVNVSGIPVGTYYSAVTTIDSEGRESVFSNEVIMTVR